MKSQVLHTLWPNISGEAAGETWNWSLLGVKGLMNFGSFFIRQTSLSTESIICHVNENSGPSVELDLSLYLIGLAVKWNKCAPIHGPDILCAEVSPFTPKLKEYILPTFLKRNVFRWGIEKW